MQIYYTDPDPAKCAANLPDGLTSKILLEVAQILCTVCYEHGTNAPYKPTHKRHPLVLWAAESWENFEWLHTYATRLCETWMIAYSKTVYHKSFKAARRAYLSLLSSDYCSNRAFTTPPKVFVQDFPDHYKCNAPYIETTTAYQQYLNWKVNNWKREKKCFRLYSWTNRETPGFIKFD